MIDSASYHRPTAIRCMYVVLVAGHLGAFRGISGGIFEHLGRPVLGNLSRVPCTQAVPSVHTGFTMG